MNTVKVFKQAHVNNKVAVLVQKLKQNTLRGDTYWVTSEVRVFKTESAADAYMQRVEQREQREEREQK